MGSFLPIPLSPHLNCKCRLVALDNTAQYVCIVNRVEFANARDAHWMNSLGTALLLYGGHKLGEVRAADALGKRPIFCERHHN